MINAASASYLQLFESKKCFGVKIYFTAKILSANSPSFIVFRVGLDKTLFITAPTSPISLWYSNKK